MRRLLFAALGMALLPALGFSATYYVPDNYSTIQGAISDATVVDGDTLIVRSGTYPENVDYLGKEITLRSESGPLATVIDGNQTWACVVFATEEGPAAVLDGFTLTNGIGKECWGGDYSGGGIACENFVSPTIQNCIVTGNSALTKGGGIYCSFASPTLINVLVCNNSSPGRGGGMILELMSGPTLINCTFYGNSSGQDGGAVFSWEAGIPVGNYTNCIFWNNSAPSHPEIFYATGAPVITYCNVKGGYTGTGNIQQNPLFANAGIGDLRLSSLSPCINRGTATNAPAVDFEGDARPFQGGYDMGFDEFIGTHTLSANSFTLSKAAGGSVQFTLKAGTSNGGRWYAIFGTRSGTNPGIPMPGGGILPMNWDNFSDLVLSQLNTPRFSNFMFILNAAGQSTAQLSVGANEIPAGMVGATLHFTYALDNPINFASNPIPVLVEP